MSHDASKLHLYLHQRRLRRLARGLVLICLSVVAEFLRAYSTGSADTVHVRAVLRRRGSHGNRKRACSRLVGVGLREDHGARGQHVLIRPPGGAAYLLSAAQWPD